MKNQPNFSRRKFVASSISLAGLGTIPTRADAIAPLALLMLPVITPIFFDFLFRRNDASTENAREARQLQFRTRELVAQLDAGYAAAAMAAGHVEQSHFYHRRALATVGWVDQLGGVDVGVVGGRVFLDSSRGRGDVSPGELQNINHRIANGYPVPVPVEPARFQRIAPADANDAWTRMERVNPALLRNFAPFATRKFTSARDPRGNPDLVATLLVGRQPIEQPDGNRRIQVETVFL